MVDPLAETSRRWSTYTYALDNPIMFVDPDGREAERCCSWNDVKAFGRGAWNTTKGLASGMIQAANPITGIITGVGNINKTYNAFKSGGVVGAIKQVGNVVYEVSGAKGVVQTGRSALKGNPEAMGSLTAMAGAVIVGGKLSGKTGSIAVESEVATLTKGTQLSRQQLSTIVGEGGAERAAQFASQWESASLSETIQKIAPESQGVTNAKGKTIYNNSETGLQVVYDNNGNYFRIEDTNLSGKRNYLDINGSVPNNKTVNGRTVGRSQSEYNQVTHFNNID